jgi:hypothetical protein
LVHIPGDAASPQLSHWPEHAELQQWLSMHWLERHCALAVHIWPFFSRHVPASLQP